MPVTLDQFEARRLFDGQFGVGRRKLTTFAFVQQLYGASQLSRKLTVKIERPVRGKLCPRVAAMEPDLHQRLM
jgi:hypothetical protein